MIECLLQSSSLFTRYSNSLLPKKYPSWQKKKTKSVLVFHHQQRILPPVGSPSIYLSFRPPPPFLQHAIRCSVNGPNREPCRPGARPEGAKRVSLSFSVDPLSLPARHNRHRRQLPGYSESANWAPIAFRALSVSYTFLVNCSRSKVVAADAAVS